VAVIEDIVDHVQAQVVDGDPGERQDEFRDPDGVTVGPGNGGAENPRQDAGEDKVEAKGPYPDLPAVEGLAVAVADGEGHFHVNIFVPAGGKCTGLYN